MVTAADTITSPRSIAVIAPAATHAAIRARFAPTTPIDVFADSEVAAALARLVHEPPTVVAIEMGFSRSAVGRSLINTLLSDPALAGAEIRVIQRAARAGAEPFDLDTACRRTVERFYPDNVEVQLDGRPERLVDLSARGAQVFSGAIVKPNQRLRVVLSTTTPDVIRTEATVVWAAFEMPPSLPMRYRAGLEFVGTPASLKNVADFFVRARATAPATAGA